MKKIKIYVMFFLVTAMLAAMLLPASAEDQIHEEEQALAGFEDLSGEQFEALWDADSESLFMLLTNVRSLAVVTDAEHVPQKGKSLRITAWSGSYFTLSSAGEVTGLPDMNNFYGFDGLAFWLDTTDSINARGKLDVTLGSGSGDSQYEVVARDIEFHGGTQAVLEVPFSAFMSDGEEDGFTFEQINSLALHFHSLGNLGGTYYLSSFSLYRDGAIRMDKLEVAREEAEEYLSSLTSEDYSRESLEEATGRFLALCEECDNPLLTGTQLRVNQLTAEFLNIPSLLRPADWRQTLAELVSLCGQADISVYTEQSLEQFFQALTEAEQALESGETDPDILRALYNALEEAWQGLEAEALYTAGLELLDKQL